MRSLERELGAKLFTRVAKDRVSPTPAARALLELAEPFITQLSETVAGIERGEALRLRIQSSGLVLRGVVAPWASRLRKQAPRIELRIDEIRRPDAIAVSDGRADLLVDFVAELPRGVAALKVASASAFIVLPRDHELGGVARPRLASLGEAELVAYPEGTIHRELQRRALADAGCEPRAVTEASTADSILALVAAGLGYSLIPWLDPRAPRHRGVVAHRVGRRGLFPIRAIYRRGTRDDPAIAAALAAF